MCNIRITSHSNRTFNSWLGSASLHIITNYQKPLSGALGGIATFFFIVKEAANVSLVFVLSKSGFRVFRQVLRHFR